MLQLEQAEQRYGDKVMKAAAISSNEKLWNSQQGFHEVFITVQKESKKPCGATGLDQS